MQFNIKFCCLLLLFLTAACDDDDLLVIENNNESEQQINENCETYNSRNIDGGNIYTNFERLGDLIVFGGINDIIVKRINEDVVLFRYSEPQLQVREFFFVDNNLLVCCVRGIFKIGNGGEISKVSSESCVDMELLNQQLVFTSFVGTLSETNRGPANIKVLDLSNFEHSYLTDSTYTDLNYFLEKFIIYNDEIFTLSLTENEIEILVFSGDSLNRSYSKSNDIGLSMNQFENEISNWNLFKLEEELFLFIFGVEKFLYKYTNQRFDLIETWNIENIDRGDLYNNFRRASMNRIKAIDNSLYINSSNGLFKIELSSENVFVEQILDPLLPSNNFISFLGNEDRIEYVLINHNIISNLNCE